MILANEKQLSKILNISERRVRELFKDYKSENGSYPLIKCVTEFINQTRSGDINLVTQKTFAEILGLSEKTVKELANRGVLEKNSNGHFDLKDNLKRYLTVTDERNKKKAVEREYQQFKLEILQDKYHLDEDVKYDGDVLKLGILQGDFVSFETRTRILDNGYIKSRYLDDKLCVAQILSYIKYLKDNKLKPKTDLYVYFSNYEEIGHGVSVFPEDLDEFIAVDIGLVAGEDAHGDEKKVQIIAKDSRSPYDFTLRKKLQETANKNNIKYTVGVYNRYGSDATTAILQGFDFKYACIGPNVDATHHYERCHNDGIVETVKLLIAYL